MTLTPSSTVLRRLSLVSLLLVPTTILYLRWTSLDTTVATTAGVAWLAVLLALSTGHAASTQRRIGDLRAELAEAYRDPVTGLAVRAVAERHLTAAAGTDLTVALVDVDDLHGINEAHTHHGGDRVLAAVAARLTAATAAGDIVARLGGDEFVLITPRPADVLAHALAAAVRQPVTLGAATLPLHVSVGICRVRGGDPHRALGCADLAMYTAKRRRSGIEHYDPARDGTPAQRGSRPPLRPRDQRPDIDPR
jgi:diguanylate cyclase (GGDEF)-like protein